MWDPGWEKDINGKTAEIQGKPGIQSIVMQMVIFSLRQMYHDYVRC